MTTPQEVLEFWLDDTGPEGWYRQSEALDTEIRQRFEPAWQQARQGGLREWRCSPRGALAYIVLTDQFPRNMFRGDARAFATDRLALRAAYSAIHANQDLMIEEPERQFFYLPYMHSELSVAQDRAVRLFLTRMPDTGGANLRHARAHREVIRKFGRFPYRNSALSRTMERREKRWLDETGYAGELNALD